MELIGYFAAIFVGLILGLLGGGGSILSIPILVYLFGIDAVLASAYSLFIVGMTSLVGAVPKYKNHLVNIQTGILFGIPSIISIFCTRKWVIPAIPEIVLDTDVLLVTKRILILGVFAILMILASFSMIKGKREIRSEAKGFKVLLVIVEGIIIGFLTGLVGAGGGFLIIPALVFLTGLPFKTAVGTSLFIIAINSLTGFIGDALNYDMDWRFLMTFTSLAVVGILVGNKLQKRISAMRLRIAFGWLVLAMGTYILIRELVLN
jgi:uncharacterized protein